MAHSRTSEAARLQAETGSAGTVRIAEECLELDLARPREIGLLRDWMRRVNGPAHPQPYLVEDSPGHFRLYVGSAAERVRTRHGIL